MYNELQPYIVIDETNAHLYHARVDFDFSGIDLEADNPVPVYEDGKLMGVANLYLGDDKKLMAMLILDYASPSRLLLEINDKVYVTPIINESKIQWLQITRQPLSLALGSARLVYLS